MAGWLFRSEESEITDSAGRKITVTDTSRGGTSLDTSQLYASKQVQDFISQTERSRESQSDERPEPAQK